MSEQKPVRLVVDANKFVQSLSRVSQKIQRARTRASKKGAEVIARRAAKIHKGNDPVRTGAIHVGRKNRRGGRTNTRRSDPGQPSAVDRGQLVKSITVVKVSESGRESISEVRIAAPHATLLEFGTAKMEPRPLLEPATKQCADEVQQIFVNEINGAMQ